MSLGDPTVVANHLNPRPKVLESNLEYLQDSFIPSVFPRTLDLPFFFLFFDTADTNLPSHRIS